MLKKDNMSSFAILGDGAVTIEKAVANTDCILQDLHTPGKKERIFRFIEKGTERRFPELHKAINYVNEEYRKESKSKHENEPYTNRLLPLAILTLILRMPSYALYEHLHSPFQLFVRCLDDEELQQLITNDNGEDFLGLLKKTISLFDTLCEAYNPGYNLLDQLEEDAKTSLVRFLIKQKKRELFFHP